MQKIWLRLHLDIRNDPKLTVLSPADRWYYVALLTMKADGTIDQFNGEMLEDVIRTQLRLTNEEASDTKKRLVRVGLIEENWQPSGWSRRQYLEEQKEDPTAAERKRRQREREKSQDVTPMSRRDSHGVTGVTSVSVSASVSYSYIEEIKKEYPKGTYKNNTWMLAEHYINVAIESGVDGERIFNGVRRYRKQQEAMGNIGTQWITYPNKFFQNKDWMEAFPLPRPSGEPPPEDPEQRKYLDEMRKKLLGD